MKRGWEAKILELIVWGSVLVEEMHTPETKKYHFSKKFACGGRLSCKCNFTNKMFTSGEAKFLELSVWGTVFVEEMHTPETKKYHFSKKFACGGRLSCNFTNKMLTYGTS